MNGDFKRRARGFSASSTLSDHPGSGESQRRISPTYRPAFFDDSSLGYPFPTTITMAEEDSVMMTYCQNTGFPLGKAEVPPLKGIPIPTQEALARALSPFILSASGWRKIFASDGNEESSAGGISPEDTLLAGLAAGVFADYLGVISQSTSPMVTVGCDTRPTGPPIAEAMIRVFLHRGCRVKYLFIAAAPEIMASSRLDGNSDGFAYISASHNPLGYNGMKFGLRDGGVLEQSRAAALIETFRKALTNQAFINAAYAALSDPSPDMKSVFLAVGEEKKAAFHRYHQFSRWTVSDQRDPAGQDRLFTLLSERLKTTPLGVVAELNGSARTLSIDETFLSSLGFRVRMVNSLPRQIVHPIIPEGASLEPCRRELNEAHGADPAYILGYVPDNDGDRGNLVYFDSQEDRAKLLQAQEVFALAVLGELAYTAWSDRRGWSEEPEKPQALSVNGPTSLRIEALAAPFRARVFRTEVGEANVVSRAREARKEGFRVRVLGEGSNGGSVIHPAAVRDPLNTLLALAKLLLIRDAGEGEGLFHLWCRLSGQEEAYRPDFDLKTILATLPAYTSTDAYEPEALLPLTAADHGALKAAFETRFPREWEKKREELERRWDIRGWREINTEGTVRRIGVGREYRSGTEGGGLKIELLNGEGAVVGFLWMRGSGTEPIFRVAAELKGKDPRGMKFLLEWLREMVGSLSV